MGLIFDKGYKNIYNREKIVPSVFSSGKVDSYVQKNEIRILPNAIHKDKLKMD